MASWERIEDEYAAAFRAGARTVARAVLEEGNRIISEEAIDTGDLLSSGEVGESPDPGGVVAWSAWAVWTAKHAVFSHFPTRPHWPPWQPIYEWVNRNLRVSLGTSEPVLKPLHAEGTRKPHKDEVAAVTQAVRAKIAREGTKGTFYATRAADIVRPKAQGMVLAEMEAHLAKLRGRR